MLEFHISRSARQIFQAEDALFGLRGNVVFINFNAARKLAQEMNNRRDLATAPELAVSAAQLNAMGLLDEINHLIMAQFRQPIDGAVLAKALDWLADNLGADVLERTLRRFAEDFPTVSLFRGETSLDEYFQGETENLPNHQVVLEEILMLWLDNENPAMTNVRELFDHSTLIRETGYLELLQSLYEFFGSMPRFGPDNEHLIDMLRRPALESPNSLAGQLEFIRKRWGGLVSEVLSRLLYSLDFIKEEEKPIFLGGGPGPARVLEFRGQEFEPENFSPDLDWMPRLVLIAKNAYVWLDQLSKKYVLPIKHLDEIPDAELDYLGRAGISGLWLIGLWERSSASQRIKQMRGNPEAVASAYSLYDYQIAADLGGEEAYQILRSRAWQRGVRLSADMVPNHMGIDSRWLVQHPDWFIGLNYSPFPTYTFNGPNLSWDERVGIYLEDHYYNNSDAAVVFKRVDHWTGDTRYIYHGNDGTSYPWNDTAQLNYLIPEVREAVIQTILHVARKFPVIRFDAAMTLSKKHFQRLWFPEPGTGGDIPSRAEFGLTREQFDAAMPVEFWREVVDRVAQEVPDTLLLAEAFWMMEGYFVRTLGMHRVYNSAFMNMLRDEKNAEYRLVIKNTLEFDPEILKRYVNFMNNPDEKTAVEQFSKGDKYFGVCIVMSTMPGLPMLGHGQIEGFNEKYGMEYKRAYWDEPVDDNLVKRHEAEVFPLLRRRYQFAQVENFLLYDFYTAAGSVDEDVFAYSNWVGDDKSLVIFHNRFKSTSGWMRLSVAYAVKAGGESKTLVQRHLAEGLGLYYDAESYTIFRDRVSGLEYIRNNKELHERGLYVELQAYQYHVFVNFRQVMDSEWRPYAQLAAYLDGRGVPDIEEARKELLLQPLHLPFKEIANASMFRWITEQMVKRSAPDGTHYLAALDEVDPRIYRWLAEVKQLSQGEENDKLVAEELKQKLGVLLRLPVFDQLWTSPPADFTQALAYLELNSKTPSNGKNLTSGDPRAWGVLLSWLLTHAIGKCFTAVNVEADELSRVWMDDWLLGKVLQNTLVDLGIDRYTAGKMIDLVRVLVAHHSWWKEVIPTKGKAKARPKDNTYRLLQTWLNDDGFQIFIGMNRYNEIVWFNKEAFDEMLWWLYVIAIVEIQAAEDLSKKKSTARVVDQITACYTVIRKLQAAEADSEYQVERLLKAAQTQ